MAEDAIDVRTSAVLLNDMMNGGLRRQGDEAHNKAIESSGLIVNTVRLVEGARTHGVPIFWVRVERRSDRADVPENLTDGPPTAWHLPNAPIVRGSYESANVDELPIQPEDHEIVKPRIDPFTGTSLDLQLRTRHISTILLGGYSTNLGVESCARTAHDLGYNVVIVSDCCLSDIPELHDFAIRNILPRFARVMTLDLAMSRLR